MQISADVDEETIRQIAVLADHWGLPPARNNTRIIARCIERVYQQLHTKNVDSTPIVCECGGTLYCNDCGQVFKSPR